MNVLVLQDAHVQCKLCLEKGVVEFVYIENFKVRSPLLDGINPEGKYLTNSEAREPVLKHLQTVHNLGHLHDKPIGPDGFLVFVGRNNIGILSVFTSIKNGVLTVTSDEFYTELKNLWEAKRAGPESI